MFESHGNRIINLFDAAGTAAFINHLSTRFPGIQLLTGSEFAALLDEAVVIGHGNSLTKSFDIEGMFLKSGNAHKARVDLKQGECLHKAVIDHNLDLRWELGDELRAVQITLPGISVPAEIEDLPSLVSAMDSVSEQLELMPPSPNVVFLKQSLNALHTVQGLLRHIDEFMADTSLTSSEEGEVYDFILEGRTRTATLTAMDEVISKQRVMLGASSDLLDLNTHDDLISLYVVRKLFESYAANTNELYLEFEETSE